MAKIDLRRGARLVSDGSPAAERFLPLDWQLNPDWIAVNFNGSAGDDIFTGGADNDTVAGNGGNDQLSGGGGHDTIGGGTGADIVDGGDGSDQLYSFDISPAFNRPYYGNPWTPPLMDTGTEFDSLSGGAGGDVLFAGYGDTADGGADSDTLYISFLGAAAGITVDFRQLQNNGSIVIGGGTLSNIESVGWIEGSNFDDVITDGNNSANFGPMFGHGGNDRLYGGYYTGNIYGGDGDDLIDRGSSPYGFEHFGEAGNDLLIGSYNGERLDGGSGNDELRGHGGFDNLFGGDGDDLMDAGSYHDTLVGGAGNDLMYGAGDADTMDGGSGDDTMHGDFSLISMGNGLSPQSNDERMWGGTGADIIYGNQGNDAIWSGERDGDFSNLGKDDAGLERDQLFGGEGNDTLSMGFGDDADGGIGSDTLRISLAGAASGVTFSTSGFVPGGAWSINGGTVQNIETLTAIVGSAFGDMIAIATHAFGINVNGGAGNDLITSSGSSVIANGGAGDDRFVGGIAGDVFDGDAGIDTADYAQYGSAVVVALGLAAGATGSGPGGDQLINVENVDGSAFGDTIGGSDQDNVLRGLGGNDTLRGNGGNDVLIGGEGDDTMEGGLGNDVFHVDDLGDVVTELAGQGTDRIVTSLSYVLSASSEVETIETTNLDATIAMDLTGSNTANTIRGNNGMNVLKGAGGNDSLFGLGGDDSLEGGADNDVLNGGAGVDSMTGGTGNDWYFVDNANDSVVEGASEGTGDRIFTSVSYTLAPGSYVEIFSTDFNAGTAAINLSGNELGNVIYGNAGNNVLDGKGGIDTLVGFGGDDWYFVDHASDYVVEGASEGTGDRVFASVSYTLAPGSYVEILSTDFHAGTAAIDLSGNALGNLIFGNAGNNVLDGKGGIDTLVGFGGDDWYYVDHASDYVVEGTSEGTGDRIFASVSYTLAPGSYVEILSTDFHAGSAALNLSGNELGNLIFGNAGSNVLDGRGGIDTLVGFGGDDSYFVDQAGDIVVEGASEGTADRVFAGTSYTLAAGSHIEILSTDFHGGTAAIDLRGNEIANVLYGNAGANVLDGKGGSDALFGFGGADTFAFTTALGAGNVDAILDFDADDTLALDDAVFAGLGLGALSANAFTTGPAATTAEHRIVYNQATGELFYDADGNGGGAAVLFASLSGNPTLTASDFIVI